MGTARIENKDSKDYVVPVKVSGSSSKVSIPKGTSTVTWQGGSHDAVVDSGSPVSFPGGKMQDGKHYTLSGGSAK
eukprot:m.491336 g.491336  ORF g.491336 m.491336 type:complete len:75 (+) comp57259_c0_seq1:61-285(+)